MEEHLNLTEPAPGDNFVSTEIIFPFQYIKGGPTTQQTVFLTLTNSEMGGIDGLITVASREVPVYGEGLNYGKNTVKHA